MNLKRRVFLKAVLWGIFVLLFPIGSGTIASICKLNTIQTILIQGCFMVLSLIPFITMVLLKKWKLSERGFGKFSKEGCKRALFFLPVLLLYVPVAVSGFQIKSTSYLLSTLFLYAFVGISEEIYYRGVIPHYLKKAFSERGTIIISTFIFGIGHIASAMAGNSVFLVFLTVVNAFLFGWFANEVVSLSGNITFMVLFHFLFDFETKFITMTGNTLLLADFVQGSILTLLALWLTFLRLKKSATIS